MRRSTTLSGDPRRPPQPRREVRLRPGYHSPQVAVDVRLNTNECPEPPPEEFLTELAALAGRVEANRYPDRRAVALCEAVAAHHGVTPASVFPANGSNEVLQCLLLAYGGEGRRALVFEPTYALHGHIARLTGTSLTKGRRDEAFHVDAGELLDLASETAADVVMLCSPNNPTGNAESASTVGQIAEGFAGLVIVDEAYAQFSRWSALDLIADHPNVAVVRTFSKTWALAALRLGYLVAHPAVADACWQVALPYHLDSLKQAGGVAALGFEEAMTARVSRLVEERGALEQGLGQLPVDTWHSDANFILFRVRDRSAADLWSALVERSVLVRDVSGFDGLDGCLRVTVGTPDENARFLDAMADALATAPH